MARRKPIKKLNRNNTSVSMSLRFFVRPNLLVPLVSCDCGGFFGWDKVSTLLLSGDFDEVASGVLVAVIPSSVIADVTVDNDTLSGSTALLDSFSDATTLNVSSSK